MGIRVAGIGVVVPGRNGVPGREIPTEELIRDIVEEKVRTAAKKLYPVKYYFASKLPYLRKRLEKKITERVEKEVEAQSTLARRRTGVELRGIYTVEADVNPTTNLASIAALNTLKNVTGSEKPFSVDDIDGFIFVSNTPDTVFPPPGKPLAKILGLRDGIAYDNTSMSCTGAARAIRTACEWLEEGEATNVLIAVTDVTSRLKQPASLRIDKNLIQNIIFADAAVCMLIQKVDEEKGGFTVSTLTLDPSAPDMTHSPHYTGDSEARYEEHLTCGDKNGEQLNKFGYYESKAIAKLVLRFLEIYGRKLSPRDKIILPQATSVIINGAFDILRKELGVSTEEEIKQHLVESAVPEHAITGAPASLIAWWKGIESGQIKSTDRVTYFNCGLGGINGFVTYDPEAPEILKIYKSAKPQELPTSASYTPSPNGNGQAPFEDRAKKSESVHAPI